jgi:hypothetical protein
MEAKSIKRTKSPRILNLLVKFARGKIGPKGSIKLKLISTAKVYELKAAIKTITGK